LDGFNAPRPKIRARIRVRLHQHQQHRGVLGYRETRHLRAVSPRLEKIPRPVEALKYYADYGGIEKFFVAEINEGYLCSLDDLLYRAKKAIRAIEEGEKR